MFWMLDVGEEEETKGPGSGTEILFIDSVLLQ
jgi:hypothetical protein